MLLPLLIACRPSPEPLPSPAEWRVPEASAGLELVLGGGVERSAVWVRSRAADGTTVVGADTAVLVEGVSHPITLSVDGYARVPVEGPGVHLVDAEGQTGRVFVRGATFADRGLHASWPGLPAPSADLHRAGDGLVALVDGRLEWFGASGFRHTVLAPGVPVVGVASGHVDDDGIVDAVAWTADSVYVLRGRAGGLVALGRLVGSDRTVGGAALGDADGDGSLDVVVAWAGGPNGGQLDVWRGDGRLAFTPSPNRHLRDRPVSVTVGTVTDDASPTITVVGDQGDWARFYAYAESWSRAGPSVVLDLPLGTAATLRDLLGNGGDELLFATGGTPGEERGIQLLDFAGEAVQRLSLDRPAHIGIQDLDGDARDDLLLADTSGRVTWVRGAAEPGALSQSTFADVPGTSGAVGATPGGAVVLASEGSWRWMDTRWDGERMRPVDSGLVNWGLTPAGGVFAVLDGTEFHVVMVDPGGRELQLWTDVDGDRSLVGRVAIADREAEVHELVLCGRTAWLLTDTELLHVDLADPAAPSVIGRDLVVATHLACDDDGAVVRLGDQVLTYDPGATPATASVLLGGPVALHDGAVATCSTDGCAVQWAPVGPGGTHVEVVGDPTRLTVDGVVVAGRGVPTIVDVDGDGRLDVLAHHLGEITVHRNTVFGLAPAEQAWTPQLLAGRLALGGRQPHGTTDLWGVVGSTGRLHRSPGGPPAQVDEPTATGDTGG